MRDSKPRVVVADDHPGMLDAVMNLLQCNGYNVIAAVRDGESALHAVIDFDPDLTVLDISMPRMDGLAAGQAIRRRGLKTKIIFLTIQSGPEYVEAARALDAGYVVKSQLYSDLLPTMADWLAKDIPARQTVSS